MLDPDSPIPDLSLQTPAVDFIDNHLPRHHPFFANLPARYDPSSRRYVAASVRGRGGMVAAGPQPAPTADAIQGRPVDKSVNQMTFWDSRFIPARAKFKGTVEEPEKRSKSGFDIREEDSWDGVYKKLQLARGQYMSKTGLGGFLKNVRRKMVDNWTQPIQGIVKFVPDIDYVTPVLGAVEILLDAMKTSAEVRNQAITAFGNLQSTFSKVELFFVLWPNDNTLKEASINLIVSTMAAIEIAIGFFIQPGWKKSRDAILQGCQYGDKLKNGLAEIESCTEVLLKEADCSQMTETHYALQEAMKYFVKLDGYQKMLKKIGDQVGKVGNQVGKIGDQLGTAVTGVNSLKESFEDFMNKYEHDKEEARERDARREKREQYEKEETKRELERQKEEERQWQEERRRHQAELDVANSKIRQLEIEKANSRAPSPYQQPPPFSPPPPPQPQAIANAYPHFPPETLWRLVDMPALEAADLAHIADKRLRVPSLDRARAELLAGRHEFAAWISALESARLLIHGDFGPRPVSALSVFCAVLARALEGRRRIVRLVWFCGRHLRAHDRRTAGGVAMLRSFVAQLLCQQWVDTRLMLRDINFDPARVRAGDMEQLLALFCWLVRRLPDDVTVFCLVDGVCFYERAGFLDGMSDVVACVVRLSMDEDIDATIKFLVTSPIATKVVRDGFEDDDLILSMKGMTALGQGGGFSALTRVAASESEDETSSEESEESSHDSSSDKESEDGSRAVILSDGSGDSATDGDSRSDTDSGSEDISDSDKDSGSDCHS